MQVGLRYTSEPQEVLPINNPRSRFSQKPHPNTSPQSGSPQDSVHSATALQERERMDNETTRKRPYCIKTSKHSITILYEFVNLTALQAQRTSHLRDWKPQLYTIMEAFGTLWYLFMVTILSSSAPPGFSPWQLRFVHL